jgi:curved DNA-binding protein CbpA
VNTAHALAVLGLSADADARALRRAYRAAVRIAHPDKKGGNAASFQIVQAAYEALVAAGYAARSPRSSRLAAALAAYRIPAVASVGVSFYA